MSKFLVGRGTPPFPQNGKSCINFASRFLYTIKQLRAHHMHHVPKCPSYFCKIWAFCVSQTYMVYIFTCLFSVCNTIIYHIMNMFNQAQWWKKYLSKEYLSLNIIKHTCSWRNKFIVCMYIYIYIYIYVYNIYRLKPSKNQT